MTAIQPNIPTPQAHSLNKAAPKFGGDGIDGGTGGSEDISALIAEINSLEKPDAQRPDDFFKQLDQAKERDQIKEAGPQSSKLRSMYNSVVVFLSGIRT